jgi:hypothetical protein
MPRRWLEELKFLENEILYLDVVTAWTLNGTERQDGLIVPDFSIGAHMAGHNNILAYAIWAARKLYSTHTDQVSYI